MVVLPSGGTLPWLTSTRTQEQTLFSWQKTIKTIECCAILYIKYSLKNLQDGVGTSYGATKIAGKKYQHGNLRDVQASTLAWQYAEIVNVQARGKLKIWTSTWKPHKGKQ